MGAHTCGAGGLQKIAKEKSKKERWGRRRAPATLGSTRPAPEYVQEERESKEKEGGKEKEE